LVDKHNTYVKEFEKRINKEFKFDSHLLSLPTFSITSLESLETNGSLMNMNKVLLDNLESLNEAMF
jgi:hypothetical protein